MKVLAISTLLALLLLFNHQYQYIYQKKQNLQQNTEFNKQKLFEIFENWKKENQIEFEYENENMMRFNTFIENYNFIESHNSQNGNDLILKINKFGAMSNKEYQQRFLSENIEIPQTKTFNNYKQKNLIKNQENVDWNAQGILSNTQDMGECNASYAFATVQALQGFSQINDLSSESAFSQQQIISCSEQNLGCQGGNVLRAYSYVKQNGLVSESSYPYSSSQGQSGTCQINDSSESVFTLSDYALTPQNSELISNNLQKTTMTVGVDASTVFWQFYSKGILSSKFCGSNINYAVTLYGVNFDNENESYWMVQNSVGNKNWGDNGYGKILNTQDNSVGTCGINQFAVYPFQETQKKKKIEY